MFKSSLDENVVGLFEKPRKTGNDGCNNKLRVAGQFIRTTVSVRKGFAEISEFGLFDDFTTRDGERLDTHSQLNWAKIVSYFSRLCGQLRCAWKVLEVFWSPWEIQGDGGFIFIVVAFLNYGERGIIIHKENPCSNKGNI